MSDLISRQAAIDATWRETGYTDPINVATAIRDRIEALPSAQSEIIRCKDCKWFIASISQCDRQICAVFFENDFCSYAERREE